MSRRKVRKDSNEHKGNDFDPFQLTVDADQLKFDDASLEKELISILGSDEVDEEPIVEMPSSSHSKIKADSLPSCEEFELLQQLETTLETSDDNGDAKPPPIDTSSSPNEGSVTHKNETLSIILERQAAFENIIDSMKSSSTLIDIDRACLHRYEQLLAFVKTMAEKAERNGPVDLRDLPSVPSSPSSFNSGPMTTSRRKTAENIVLDYVTGETPKSRSTSSSDSKEAAFVRELKARLTEYRNAAVLAHKEGKKPREAELMVAINALAEAIPRIESGVEQFDPADMPPPPEQFHLPPEALAEVTEGIQQGSSAAQSSASPPLGKGQPLDPTVAAITKVASSTVASRESLTARIQILKAMIQKADASDKRLYERTLQSYNKALRAFEAGIKFNYGGLNPLPSCPQFTSAAPPPQPSTAPTTSPAAGPASSSESRKLELLRKRQTELRVAAAQAKARGDMGAAREYLRSSLSMNNMIRSVNAGLPIDLKQLPPPPGASIAPTGSSQTQPILSGVACAPPVEFQTALVTAGNDPVAICDQLINQLEAQATEAEILSKDHREAGLSNLADKFFDLADVSRKWIALTTAYKRGSRVPKYVFEKANLSRLNMNTDLGDGVLEVTVVRGISLPVPPDLSGPSALDTYVTLELPFPSSETPQKHSTEWARHTNEPTDYGGYQASARFEVNRKARSYERLLQGIKSLKATVYYNRGLLKRPAVLGTVTAKLTELMANATHTACYDLMDGRKAAGGLLELRFRHRTPLHGAKFSAYQKPWLCISTSKTRPMPNIKK
ncbi:Coiled-coil and C2 domain-containing protein 1-like protein [Echinococcus granulosus]|nr:Coiled-coil and C2 domain-containing protein 1-like protein [Echinococcus granulosus]EUB56655.1 Coiled-coil and C2 domain-containing protein 1-like protein [Echinococcus granulosus]